MFLILSVCVFINLFAQAVCDTRSIFKWSLTGLIQSFPSPRLVAIPRLKRTSYPMLEEELLDS